MLDGRAITLVPEDTPPLPIETMVLGKPAEEVAQLMPRLFNLCRAAQGLAVRMALSLPASDDLTLLRQEIIRDHVLRLAVVLPGHFGQSPLSLPQGWQQGSAQLATALFGPRGQLPETPDAFETYLQSGDGLGALWQKIATLFAPGEAAAPALPVVSPETACDPAAPVENSCAVRVMDHPVVAYLEQTHGRGPLWRVVARSYDLSTILNGAPLQTVQPAPGIAQVPATRGLYTVVARADQGRVTAFARVTPTDHLRARGGVLDHTLASLPASRAGLVPLIMDILDPCSPIRIREVAHA